MDASDLIKALQNTLGGGGRSLIAAPSSRLPLKSPHPGHGSLRGRHELPQHLVRSGSAGHCKVYNGLTCDHVPTAPTAQLPAPSPGGDTLVREAANEFPCATLLWPAVPSGTARQIARHCAGLRTACAPTLSAPCLDRSAARWLRPSPSGVAIASQMKDHDRRLMHEPACETVTAPGDVSAAIGLARLVAAWRETGVRTHRSRSRKSAGVFNCADVHQGGERPYARHRHQKTAERVRPDPLLHRLIEDCDLLAQLPPSGEQRAHDEADFRSALEQRLDPPIKSEPPTGAGQQAEGLQHAAYHVGEPRRHAHELRASSKESSIPMRIERLYVDWPIPSRAHDLRQSLGVVLVGFVEPHLQRGLHTPGVQTLDIKASAAQAVHEPGRHRAGLDTDFDVNNTGMPQHACRDRSGVSDACTSPEPPALLVHNANRRRLLRHVQPNIMRHRNLRWCKPPGDSARIAALSIACATDRDYPRSTYGKRRCQRD